MLVRFILTFAFILLCKIPLFAENLALLNISYDPTRELFKEYNEYFIKNFKSKNNKEVKISQSHGGSSAQARSVLSGLEADVVSLALGYDIDLLAQKGKLETNWRTLLPFDSAPYTSTIVFVVRAGNPKKISDWSDLARSDVKVVMPNPKTSGAARWGHLAALGYALEKFCTTQDKIKKVDSIESKNKIQSKKSIESKNEIESQNIKSIKNICEKADNFMKNFYKNIPVLDSGARGASNTFLRRKIGDVLVSWENEAHLITQKLGKNNKDGGFLIIYPSSSIKAEPNVAVISANAKKHGTQELAREYCLGLYEKQAQEIIARNFYRPQNKQILEQNAALFPHLRLFSIADFGGWQNAQKENFFDGGYFDVIQKSLR